MMKARLNILFSFFLSLSSSVFAGDVGWKNDDLAIKYHYNSGLQQDWALRALQKIDLRETERILDFGSGDGKITAALAIMSGADVHGYDISRSMHNLAKALYPKDTHPQLAFHQIGQSDELPDDESFDLVTSFCVFHLVSKPVETLKMLSKSLRKGGNLLITLPAGGNSKFFDAVNKTFEKYSIKPPWTNKIQSTNEVNVRDINNLKKIAIDAGFKPLKAELIRNKNRFVNKKALIDWFIGTLTANWNIKDDIRSEFFADLADNFLETSPEAVDSTGAIRFELDRIDFLGLKAL